MLKTPYGNQWFLNSVKYQGHFFSVLQLTIPDFRNALEISKRDNGVSPYFVYMIWPIIRACSQIVLIYTKKNIACAYG